VKPTLLVTLSMLICGCAFNRPDHFYVLDAGNSKSLAARTAFTTQLTLLITLPVLVDRNELVLMQRDGVKILEHERWAAPLADQVTGVLGQDIEARREDVIMASRHMAQPQIRNVTLAVDVVQLYLQQGVGVRLEARWRLTGASAGAVAQGRETFTAPVADANYASFARAIDECLGLLADKLVADLPD
jgi:uncharacterized lipoprotein YmbA